MATYRAKTRTGRTIQIVADSKEELAKIMKRFDAALIDEKTATPAPVEVNRVIETAETSKRGRPAK